MALDPQLWNIIVDKGILAGLLAVVVYWSNKRLAKYNSDRQKELQTELARFNSDHVEKLQKELADLRERHEGKIEDFKAALALALKKQDQDFSLNLQMREEQRDLARGLRDLEAQKDLQIAAARLPAYQRFWEILDVTSPTLKLKLPPEQREELEDKLRAAFFQNGHGIFLSHSALTRYRVAMRCLQMENTKPETIRRAFSRFRTQLKTDVKVYTQEEAKTPTVAQPIHKGTDADSRP